MLQLPYNPVTKELVDALLLKRLNPPLPPYSPPRKDTDLEPVAVTDEGEK